DAPYVKEFPLILECRVIQVHEIGVHTQFIGEILDVKADDTVLDEQDNPDIQLVKPFSYAPREGGYYGTGSYLGAAYELGGSFVRKPDR
ncbi:MAG: flavin reductase, partial [Fidelibacterota bacterium]